VIERQREHSAYLLFEHLAAVPGLTHAVFTRLRGFSAPPFAGLNASSVTGDDLATVRRNKAEITATLSLPLVGAKPVHGGAWTVVERQPDERGATGVEHLYTRLRDVEADAMLSNQSGFALCWAYGDCAPILLYDPQHRAFALLHAGWRGTAALVSARAIAGMTARYGTRPAELLAGVGPAIGSCCYEIGTQVREAFAREPLAHETAVFAERDDSLYLDVAASNVQQLLAAGVQAGHIETSGYCTGCRRDLFYSHRREPWPSGRHAVAIGLRHA